MDWKASSAANGAIVRSRVSMFDEVVVGRKSEIAMLRWAFVVLGHSLLVVWVDGQKRLFVVPATRSKSVIHVIRFGQRFVL